MSESRKIIKKIVFSAFALILLTYIIFQSRWLILGPRISISQPVDGETVSYGVIEVKGKAENIAYIYLNDRQIYVDASGAFNEKLLANRGYSIIKLTAKDRFGRTTEKLIRVVVENDPFSAINKNQSLTPTSTISTTTGQ